MNKESLPTAPSKLLADELERLEKESGKIMEAERIYAEEQEQMNEENRELEAVSAELKGIKDPGLEELFKTAIKLLREISDRLKKLGH